MQILAELDGKITELGQDFGPVRLYFQGFCLKLPKFWVSWVKLAELTSKFAWVRPKYRSELGAQNRKKNTVNGGDIFTFNEQKDSLQFLDIICKKQNCLLFRHFPFILEKCLKNGWPCVTELSIEFIFCHLSRVPLFYLVWKLHFWWSEYHVMNLQKKK